MIKEDNLGDANFISHFIKWAVSVPKCPKNLKMGCKAGNFSRIKSKKEGNAELRAGLAFGSLGILHFWLSGTFTET